MRTAIKIIIALLVVVLVLCIAAFAVVGFWLPYKNALASFGFERELALHQRDDGAVRIVWPESENTDTYLVEILIPSTDPEVEPQVVFSQYVSGWVGLTVDDLSGLRTIRIRPVREYRWPFFKEVRYRVSEDAICVTDDFQPPRVEKLEWATDEVLDTVTVNLTLTDDAIARYYQITDKPDPVLQGEMTGSNAVLHFGDGQTYPLPKHGETAEFAFDAYFKREGYTYYGLIEQSFSVIRDDFLGTDLTLTCTENPNDSVTFTWNETKGDYYQFQYRASSGRSWKTLATVDCFSDRTYYIGNLTPYSHQEYRVIALHENVEVPVAESSVVSVDTESVLLYSTIWPISDLKFYKATDKADTWGSVKKGTALCVMDIKDGMFYVYYNKHFGYIDSNHCLINLPDFIGDLCKYDITNSYSSVFKFHEFVIPEVTETVIVGYEEVQLTETTFLVPLLYPTALKLEKAAQAAQQDGYFLKIYDAFRPQKATTELYNVATAYCAQPLTPEDLAMLAPESIPTPPEGVENYAYTYELFITDNGRYKLNFFLAKGISMHNRGLALDLTLEKYGQDLEMQTPIHDLSWFSEVKENNNNAKKLAKYMTKAGFGTLTSEWWHFQDNDAKKNIAPAALGNGITPEGWVLDDNGWRYRRVDGRFYKNCTRTIGGTEYTFDANGYIYGNLFEDIPEEE